MIFKTVTSTPFLHPQASKHKLSLLVISATAVSLSLLIPLPLRAAEADELTLPLLESADSSPFSTVQNIDARPTESQLPNPSLSNDPSPNIPSLDNQPSNQLIDTQPSSLEESGYSAVGSYLLGAGDEIRLEIFRLPEHSGTYEVLIDGVLNLPLVGQVVVAGLTIEQAEQVVAEAYSQRLRRPLIDLFLVKPRPLRVGVAGEVSRPGEYILQREGTQFPSLVNALETAGGITQSADLRQVVIQRPDATGQTQTIVADLWQFLNTGDLRFNTALRDGDTVYIPTRDSFDSAESIQLAAASFAANDGRPVSVAVVGEVFRPGPYVVNGRSAGSRNGNGTGEFIGTAQPTVTQAIQTAGGIQPEANLRAVQVYRRTRDGSQQIIDVNLWQLLTDGDITEDIVLQEGDTIVVPEAEILVASEIAEVAAASFSPGTIRVNVVGEVDRPGSVEVPPNTPLSQGVLAAGGFNNRARQTNVELIRLNSNGTATRTSIDVDFAQGIDESENPLLRNNDVIIVGRSGTATLSDALDSVVSPLGRAFSLFTIPASIFNLFN